MTDFIIRYDKVCLITTEKRLIVEERYATKPTLEEHVTQE